ncbi:hypothetical protein AOA12_19035 [Microbacterium sp. No. 7]|nr:hypothetical protein AOA12_19035 [Microbacterium sp. No. 7]
MDPSIVGTQHEDPPVRWGRDDAILYALGVGAGSADPCAELEYTTENTPDRPQVALPSFPLALGGNPIELLGDVALAQVLHAAQSVRLPGPFPVAGAATCRTRVDAVHDKGRDALVRMSSALVDLASGATLAETSTVMYILGGGGFGGERGPSPRVAEPDRAPDRVVEVATRPEQALLYRLSGDRNPLHSDPRAAAAAGFPRPVLHGLCTFGIVCRTLLAGADAAAFERMTARFAAPVVPGETITVRAWDEGDGTVFDAWVGSRRVLADGGFGLHRDGE